MKVLHLNTHDIQGGAARAAYRLHTGLRINGINTQMMVQNKLGDDATVIGPQSKIAKGFKMIRPTLDKLPLYFYRKKINSMFSVQYLSELISAKVQKIKPDIIHLHWICGGFIKIESISKFNKPLVWTLHDMWAFTGGCHYSGDCTRYADSCGVCPQLYSKKNRDLSRYVWMRKSRAWKRLNLTIVTPSRWLANCAQVSSLFRNCRTEVIPNGINIETYKPLDRKIARNILSLPQDKKLILFGAINATGDPRKGFQYLQPALKKLSNNGFGRDTEIIIVGASQPIVEMDLGFKWHYMGKLSDDISLALLYSAADVFVAPSVQDNLPNTIMEALACGTPCVSFDIGGMPDMIDHQQNGYLAKPFDAEDLSAGIAWVLGDEQRFQVLSRKSREKVELNFKLETVSKRYHELYSKILSDAYRRPQDKNING